MPTIDKALNLVVGVRIEQRLVEEEDKKPRLVSDIIISAFHTPISREVFEANYRIIAAAKRALFAPTAAVTDNRELTLGYADAARIATLALKEAAVADAVTRGEEEPDKPAEALLTELERLTHVLLPTENGYERVPAAVAIHKKMIDKDEWAEALSGIVFFTCASQMTRKSDREWMAPLWASVLPGLTTSLPLTDYLASLQTSTPSEASTPKELLATS